MSSDTGPPKFGDETEPVSLEDVPEGLHLVVFSESEQFRCELPRQGTITVGRAEDNQVRIDVPSISRHHLKLAIDTPMMVEDLASQNGVRVRGRRIPPNIPCPVGIGEAIQLGSVVLLISGTAVAEQQPEHPFAPVVIDPQMRRLHEAVLKVAPTELSVLVLGETGVGKELVAEAVHRHSRRHRGPLVTVNCGALAPSVIESELFGHVRGAFTGATQDRQGVFEAAHGGTIFLDEVGELSESVQVKLLRALEQSEVARVGSVKPRPVNCRVVAATNRDLERDSSFRRDLFFRLNGVTLEIPPLRQRRSEILPLANYFVRQSAARHGTAIPLGLSQGFIERLKQHPWPGNVRELRNIVERAVVLAAGAELEVKHLPEPWIESLSSPEEHLSDPSPADERQRIVDALAACSGNQTRAAEMLGMSRRTLVNRLDAYNIPRPRKR